MSKEKLEGEGLRGGVAITDRIESRCEESSLPEIEPKEGAGLVECSAIGG